MAYRGDLIGCTVLFQELKDGKVPIQFTLNGKQVTQDKIFIQYNPPEKSLYPFIGMGHTGTRVLVKFCPSPNDDAHLIGTIKATTDSMTEMMAFNWKKVDAIVKQIKRGLKKADKEFEKLNETVLENVGHLQQLIEDHDQVGRDDHEAIDDPEKLILLPWVDSVHSSVQDFNRSSASDKSVEPVLEPIKEKEISYLNEKDGPALEDQQPQNSLLKRAHENLEELKQTTDTKFDSVFKSLTAAKNEVIMSMEYKMETRERLESSLGGIQESLKAFLKARLSHSSVQPSSPNY